MKETDSVSIDPLILEDQSYNTRHHILKRIIKDNEIGTIRDLDIQRSAEHITNSYWVKFHVAAIRIDEKYLIKQEL